MGFTCVPERDACCDASGRRLVRIMYSRSWAHLELPQAEPHRSFEAGARRSRSRVLPSRTAFAINVGSPREAQAMPRVITLRSRRRCRAEAPSFRPCRVNIDRGHAGLLKSLRRAGVQR